MGRILATAALAIAFLSACADLWLEPDPRAAPAETCGAGLVLDPSTGGCVAARCTSDDACPASQRCDLIAGRCVDGDPGAIVPNPLPAGCAAGVRRCLSGPVTATERCVDGNWIRATCEPGQSCVDGLCTLCEPGERRCPEAGESGIYETCSADGSAWLPAACPDLAAICDDGLCRICDPGARRCADAGNAERCDGAGWITEPCETGTRCDPSAGPTAGTCVAMACTPGEARCDEDGIRQLCALDGSGFVDAPCATGRTCHEPGARCLDACEAAVATGSFSGCDFWLANLPNQARRSLAARVLEVTVANPGDRPATIRIESASDVEHSRVEVAAGEVATLADLPWRALPGSGTHGSAAFRVRSDEPVIVHQVSTTTAIGTCPRGCGGSCPAGCVPWADSAGGSLVLPAHLLSRDPDGSTRYLAVSTRHQEVDDVPAPASLAIVATQDGTTVVVDPAGWIAAAADGSFSALHPGSRAQAFTLDAHDVLQLATTNGGADQTLWVAGLRHEEHESSLTGTEIRSDKPVAVFAGADCVRLPFTSSVCDHVEEQLPPVSSWGTSFVALRTPTAASDRWLIVTDAANQLHFSAPVLFGGAPVTSLAVEARGSVEVVGGDFELSAEDPILVARLGERPEPSMALLAPVDGFRQRYLIRPPAGPQYLALAAPEGEVVRLSGQPVAGWTPLAGTSWRIARQPICAGAGTPCDPAGRYEVEGSAPFGLTVEASGAGWAASYGGGLSAVPGLYLPPGY